MKLIVQIPCFNEEETLPATVRDTPRDIPGFDKVEILIIDDGSTDRTVEVAKRCGVDHIVRNKSNQGLARTFAKGLAACLERGADVIVNTDGDNQYAGSSIPDLVRPILTGEADLVIGDRQTQNIDHFSPIKKLLQRIGSYIVRTLSGIAVGDMVSGFRAYSRDCAIETNVLSSFSYTIETIIQAGTSGRTVVSVPVKTNEKTRKSRLFKSATSFIYKQVVTLVRAYVMYRPLKSFSLIGATLTLIGAIPIVRFLVFYLLGDGEGRLQSLVLGGVLVVLGFLTFVLALLADTIAMNRRLLEANLFGIRRLELEVLNRAEVKPDIPQEMFAAEVTESEQ